MSGFLIVYGRMSFIYNGPPNGLVGFPNEISAPTVRIAFGAGRISFRRDRFSLVGTHQSSSTVKECSIVLGHDGTEDVQG